MYSRSNWSRASCSSTADRLGGTRGLGRHRAAIEKGEVTRRDHVAGAMMNRRSIRLRSSRTLPGQAYRCSNATASPRKALWTPAVLLGEARHEESASTAMSS
jgi:hypothetical protein